MKKLCATALATFALASVPAHADETDYYNMSMTMTDNGEVIAEPELRVRLDEQVEVHIEPGDGRVYRARMTFSRADNNELQMVSTFDLITPNIGEATFEPELKFAPHEVARIEYGFEAPRLTPFRAEISLAPE